MSRFGINVIGCVSSNTGLGVSARNIVRLLLTKDCPVSILDLDPGESRGGYDRTFSRYFVKRAEDLSHPVNLTVLPMVSVPGFLVNSPFELISAAQLNVGCFWWELEVLPKRWIEGLGLFDVLLAGSRFIQDVLKSHLENVSTLFFRHPLYLPAEIRSARAQFNLPGDAIVYVTICEPTSDLNRKNPFAAVDAFNRALRDNSRAHLVVRLNNAGAGRLEAGLEQLRSRCQGNDRIHILDRALSYEDILRLYASADVFVALHRSEGLGLGLMEAMRLGKPVIATAWSGNMSYMDQTNACLVRYSLIDVEPTVSVYRRAIRGKRAVWADPDLDHASAWMKALADEPDRRLTIGRKAAQDMANYQRQAEDGCFLDELRRLTENRGDLARNREERRQRLEDFRRVRADSALSMRARLSRKMGDIFNRHVLGKF
jgi:glycosyltransferase involved in cell wall biosynthesis